MALLWKPVPRKVNGRTASPAAWSASMGDFYLTVHFDHVFAPGVYSIECPPWYYAHTLKDVEYIEDAQELAEKLARQKFESAMSVLNGTMVVRRTRTR